MVESKGKFTVQIDEIIETNVERLNALMRESIQEVIDIAQTPGPSKKSIAASIEKGLGAKGRGKNRKQMQGPITAPGKGGRMRVDTGFLRASGRLSLNGMPGGPVRGDDGKTYDYDESLTVLQLGKAQLGDVIYFGWSASYAQYREAFDGFLATAVQQWPQIVARVTAQIRAQIK